jgi:N-acetylglucosamine-6-sulfatase
VSEGHNTLVFFVTDNGFLLGEHRLQEKKAEPYEESSRTPYVVRGAGVVSGAVSDAPVGTVDLPATFAALAGADTSGLDGRDLRDVLGGTIPPELRKRLLVDHPGNGWQMLREGDYTVSG